MNKYLLMSAAAAFAATTTGGIGVANATTLHLGTTGTSDYCDYYVVTNNGGGLYAGKHVGALACGTSVYNDPGYLAGPSTSPFGTRKKSVGFADTVRGGANALEFVFSYPFKADKTGMWLILANSSGSTTFVLNHGNTSTKVTPGGVRHESSVAHALAALKITK